MRKQAEVRTTLLTHFSCFITFEISLTGEIQG